MKKKWNSLPSGDCTDEFPANSAANFFPRTCCAKHKKHKQQRRTWPVQRRIPLQRRNDLSVQQKVCGDVPMSQFCNVLEQAVNVTSTNRSCCLIQHAVPTYEQTKKGLSYIYY